MNDDQFSLYIGIDAVNDLTMHGQSGMIIMKRNVDDATYAQAGTVLNKFLFTGLLAANSYIFGGEFLTYTGFSDKGIIAIGTTTKNESLHMFKVSDGSNVESFGAINTGSNTSFTNYQFQYFNNFEEVP